MSKTTLSGFQTDDNALVEELKRQLREVRGQHKADLVEMDLLRQEIHHRVKNNLQIVSSILTLNTEQVTNPEVEEVLKLTRSRIDTISLIHKKLYEANQLSGIDMKDYVSNQILDQFHIFSKRSRKISLDLDLQPVFLSVDRAIHCALLINELVVNAIWHAFDGRDQGRLTLVLKPSGNEQVMLNVADDGVGLPEHIEPCQTRTVGLRMVHNFILRLGGTLELSRVNGTRYKIEFPRT